MCGIAGIVNIGDRHAPPDAELLQRMGAAIHHRGPDEQGLYRDERAGLVSARLSIIDIATGQQPLSGANQKVWIVFNGEIFNYIELRRELESLGHESRTHSDTEVIVHAFEQWGNECFRRFNGQWAIALWDSVERRLTLCRDRLGVRPLYVRENNGRIWFASEVKSLFADPDAPRKINLQGLDQTFTYWSPVAPLSSFDGIEELPPGRLRTYDRSGRRHEENYWVPEFPGSAARSDSKPVTVREATEALREKLMKATELRMLRADVPVGSYLSGGLDSSLVAWMGRRVKQGTFRTFSIRFEGSEYDETGHQRMMVSALASDHTDVLVTRQDIANVFPDVVRHTERIILRTAPAPLYLLSRLVHDAGFKCVLTGEGADELLAGYDIFREAKIRSFWAKQPGSTVRPRLFERLYPYLARSPQQTKGLSLEFWRQDLDRAGMPGFSHGPRWRTTSSLKKFFSQDVRSALVGDPAPDVLRTLPPAFATWDPLAQAQYLEIMTLFSGYIISSQGDRMLMAHSVEGRFPFLDAEVIGYCNSLPAEYKLMGLDEKFLLKRVARGIIPEEIIRRKKQPYRAPDAICFVAADAPSYVEEMLSEQQVKKAGLFNPAAVSALYTKLRRTAAERGSSAAFSNSDNMAFVGILSAQILWNTFVQTSVPMRSNRIKLTTRIERVQAA